MSTFSKARLIWLFERQNGVCYLLATSGCRRRHGQMHLDVAPHGRQRPDLATREHVRPKSKKARGEPGLLLLACHQCNFAKAAKETATPAQLALARKLHGEWHALSKACSDARVDVGQAVNQWLLARGMGAGVHSTRYREPAPATIVAKLASVLKRVVVNAPKGMSR